MRLWSKESNLNNYVVIFSITFASFLGLKIGRSFLQSEQLWRIFSKLMTLRLVRKNYEFPAHFRSKFRSKSLLKALIAVIQPDQCRSLNCAFSSRSICFLLKSWLTNCWDVKHSFWCQGYIFYYPSLPNHIIVGQSIFEFNCRSLRIQDSNRWLQDIRNRSAAYLPLKNDFS